MRETATFSVPPAKAYAAMLEVGKWWGSDHTFSGRRLQHVARGEARRLLVRAAAFRRRRAAHDGRVAASGPHGPPVGGLGPLQTMGVAGSMEWKFDPAENGTTKVELRYTVGGYSARGGFKQLAPGVESVLKTQFDAYKRYAETGKR